MSGKPGSAKKSALSLALIICVLGLAFSAGVAQTASTASQQETWTLQGYAVGQHTGNEQGGVSMAEVKMLPNGNYRMYYASSGTGGAFIKYADSTDLVHWTVKGTALVGSSSPSAADYDIRGPSVMLLANGTYRMYVQASAKGSIAFEEWYATSSDGATFTMKGATITSSAFDPSSTLTLAGQGTYFQSANGTYVVVFSGKFVTDPVATPSDLKMATSSNGLTWKNYQTLYAQWHDPVVLKTSSGYKMYATYLLQSQGTAFSSDGISWPSQLSGAVFQDQSGNVLTEGNSGVGDIGGVVASNGQGLLYANYGNPSNDIVYFASSSWPTTTSATTSSSTSLSSTQSTTGTISTSTTATSTVPTTTTSTSSVSTTTASTSTSTMASTTTTTTTSLTTTTAQSTSPITTSSTTSTGPVTTTLTTPTSATSTQTTSTSTASPTTSSSNTVSSTSSSSTAVSTTSPTTSTTQQATTATTTGGGGIPEFPYQLVVTTVFTVILVVSYLLGGKGGGAQRKTRSKSPDCSY